MTGGRVKKGEIVLSEIYCCGQLQILKEWKNIRNQETYYHGQCIHCKKRFLERNGKTIEAQAAKRVWKKIKDQARPVKVHFKVTKNPTCRYYCGAKMTVKAGSKKKGSLKKVKYEYQVEKYFDTRRSTGIRTPRTKIEELTISDLSGETSV